MNVRGFDEDGYKPIRDYAAIGNLRTAAIVGIDGSIDWCCLPDMADASVFAALLDRRKGGRFALAPPTYAAREQHYVERTNVLETCFTTERGRLVVTDFMPLTGDIDGQGERSETVPAIVRCMRAEGRGIEAVLEWSPRFDYARAPTRITVVERGAVAESDSGESLVLAGLPTGADVRIDDDNGAPTLRATIRLPESGRCSLVCMYGATMPEAEALAARAEDVRVATIRAWQDWIAKGGSLDRDWTGEWREAVERSELALKLLVHADSGALAAAVTTSLPETIGGVRNWDYRFSWIRDAALIGQSLLAVGHKDEMVAFLEWAERVSDAHADREDGLKIVYGLHGEERVEEEELGHLEGYARSSPVRIGNGGFDQTQHDIFGELVDAAYELGRVTPLSEGVRKLVRGAADRAMAAWREPDYGIWEMRNGPKHFVWSKVKVWEALTLAAHMADEGTIEGTPDAWRRVAAEVKAEVLERGFDRDLGAFKIAYDTPALDAANLAIPLIEFLPPTDPRVVSTIDRSLERITANGLVYRYRTDDGLPGEEGAFGLTTFKLVDALALAGRCDEAYEIFEGIAGRANHVGLFAEQIDPTSGDFLGNFPQAFTHVGLINSLLYLAHGEGRSLPVPPLVGTEDHRRLVGRA